MTTPSSAGPSRRRLLASYAAIAMPMAAMGMPIAVYLPRFYAEVVGLSLATVGMIFTAARLFDVVTDPLMGVAIDRFHSRWEGESTGQPCPSPCYALRCGRSFFPMSKQPRARSISPSGCSCLRRLHHAYHCAPFLGGGAGDGL